jgi:murein DD-endopeptidase MepM/ murein hydrolase activator NlpD
MCGGNGRLPPGSVRPADRATSSHFYVALSGSGDTRYLLETSYGHVLRYQAGQPDRARPLSAVLQVDVSGWQERIYVLSRNERRQGELALFSEAGRSAIFRVNAPLYRPRQIQATATAVYALDQAGRRLLVLQPDNGRVQQIIRLRGQEPITAFHLDDNGRLLLATAERLYFVDEPERNAIVNGAVFDGRPAFDGRPPHNETILRDLVGLAKPIAGSPLTQRPIQLPGAPRHYRLGIHEGLDFYWQAGTAVYAIADGTVIRADYDYVPPTEWQYWAWRDEAQRLTYTSETAHDVFRGRQIWIAHENGTISRYAHLSALGGGLAVGTAVSQGQYIGAVGNSGSPLSLEGPDGDAHLHLEIWAGDYFLGQFLRPIEIMEWLEEIFP